MPDIKRPGRSGSTSESFSDTNNIYNIGESGTATGVTAGFKTDDSFEKSSSGSVDEWPASQGPPFAPNLKQINPDRERGIPGTIQPSDHFRDGREPLPTNTPVLSMSFYTKNTDQHFINDHRQNISQGTVDAEADYVRTSRMGELTHSLHGRKFGEIDNVVAGAVANSSAIVDDITGNEPVFSASVTDVNQFDDPVTEKILESGTLSNYLEDVNKEAEIGEYEMPPTSPMHPFTRMNTVKEPYIASKTLFSAYNRTKLPVADTAWRKGFRHIFITRPECYLWYNDESGSGICDQAYNDTDFQSAYTRMPHIIRLLSPYYVAGSYPKRDDFQCNWNFLLSNMVQGMSVSELGMSITDNVTKSIEGYTVTPAGLLEGRQGSTLDLTFKDTNNLEVFENLRLWELYEYKRKKGIFAPPFNGYKKTNGFINMSGAQPKAMSDREYWAFHPYDRALEYCASLYDIITNETGTKILYWCKYYGIYPTKVSPSLNNENNAPITDMSVSATFKYHYKLENSNKTLVEFNHDAGLVDHVGRIIGGSVTNSESFMLRQDGVIDTHGTISSLLGNETDTVLPNYIGASGMFTGSPYIVIARSRPDPLEPDKNVINVPNLRFLNVKDSKINGYGNLRIQSNGANVVENSVISYE